MSNNKKDEQVIHHYKFRRRPNRSIGGDIGIYIFLAFFLFMLCRAS